MQNRSAYGKMVNHFFHRIMELNPLMGYKEAHNNAINRAALDGYKPSGRCRVEQADSVGGTEMICEDPDFTDIELRIAQRTREFYQHPDAQSLTLEERQALRKEVVRLLQERSQTLSQVIKSIQNLE